jgi:hypothetical protein
MAKLKLKSTYGLSTDFSYVGERFLYVPVSWKSHVNILYIRIAKWKPKEDRSGRAIFYYDVETQQEADEIISLFKLFDFKAVEDRFDVLWCENHAHSKNTGERRDFVSSIMPLLKTEFQIKKEL